MIATLPANIAYAPLATFVPLYILAIGGNVVQVALAAVAFNAVAMSTSFIWGKISDDTRQRKSLILVSYIAITILLTGMYYAHSIYGIMLLYAGIGIFQPASNTYNLLVMETDRKENWSRNLTKLQAIGNIGVIIGLAIAAAIAGIYGLHLVLEAFVAASVISIVFAAAFVIEPEVHPRIERSLLNRINDALLLMLTYPFRFVHMPKLHLEIKYMFKLHSARHVARSLGTPIALLCIAWFMYNIGMSMLNTEYSASLAVHGLSKSPIFTIMLAGMVLQTVMFYYSKRIIGSEVSGRMGAAAVALRGIAYTMIGTSFLASGLAFFSYNIITYTIAIGIAYPLYFTSSYMLLLNSLGDERKGGMIGLYSGIGWIGYFLGAAVAAGAVTQYGFMRYYMISSIPLFAAMYIFLVMVRSAGATALHKKMLSGTASANALPNRPAT
jgi:hypothetical protein